MLAVILSLPLACRAKLKGESGLDGTAREAIAGVGAEAPRRIGAETVAFELEEVLVVRGVGCASPSGPALSSLVGGSSSIACLLTQFSLGSHLANARRSNERPLTT